MQQSNQQAGSRGPIFKRDVAANRYELKCANQKATNDGRQAAQKLQWLRSAVQLAFLALLAGGLYGAVRPAFVALMPLAFLAGNYFCGWICPFGTAQELLGRLGALLVKGKLKMPPALQRYLQFSRYVLAAIILSHVAQSLVDLSAINAYKTFMRAMTGNVAQTAALVILGSFLVIALFFERPFCNYCCTEGVRFGVLSLGRLVTIKRSSDKCVNCRLCDKACPMNLSVAGVKAVRHAQCINCFQCLAACPVGALEYGKISLKRKRLAGAEADS